MKGLFLLLALAGGVAEAQRAQRVELLVASTTDVHGRLVGWDYFGGSPDTLRALARAATIVDSLRGAHPGRVVLVDAGDLFQGNPLTYVAARVDTAAPHPVIAAMNVMRYDAAAVGNHEFNYGLPTLRAALRQARFPFLGANITPISAAERRAPLFAPSRMITRSGVRIAIVGATTPGSMVWDRENLAGRLQVTDIVPAVKRTVRRVRAQGADLVLVVMHSGLDEASSYDTVTTRLPSENVAARVAREVPGIDLLVFGHSHREIADTTINGTLLMQPRNWAQSVGVATVTMERRGGRWRVNARRGQLLQVRGRREHAGVVAAVDRAHRATQRYVTRAVGETRVRWSADSARVKDTPIIDFILEAQRARTGADLSATAAFDLNAVIDSGPVTVAEIARLYPYDNTLRAVRISGKQLREFLEFSAKYYRQRGTEAAAPSLVDPAVPGFNFDMISGADYTLDISRPVGQRVTTLTVQGRAVRDEDSFTMALNNYRQTGGGGFAMLHGAPVVYDRQEEIRDVLIAEVQRRGDLRPEDFHRVNWRLLPEGVEGEAWRAMRSLPYDRSTGTPRPSVAGSQHLASGRWLRIIGSSDFHGGIQARDFAGDGVVRGGAPSFIAAIRAARAECPAPSCTAVWLDAGDQWQGTPESGLQLGRPVTTLFNRNGLTAAALGNHEFDWGVDSLQRRLRDNAFPVLGANIRDASGRVLPWLPGDTILTIGGLKLGLIGVLTKETPRIVRASFLLGMTVLPAAAVIDSAVPRLRARGADVVIVLAHVGAACERQDVSVCTGEAVELVESLQHRPDGMILGHQHRPTATIVRGTPMVQAWQKGSGIGLIDIPLDGGAPVVALRNVLPDSPAGAPDVLAWTDSLVRDLNVRLSERVGSVSDTLRRGAGRNLGDLVADAFRVAGDADVALVNAGASRVDLVPGPVTLADAYAVLPFGNQVMRFTVSGRVLLEYLGEIGAGRVHLSGVRIEVDTTRAPRERVLSARFLNGQHVVPGSTYRLVMPDFVAEGPEGMGIAERASRVETLPIVDRDALAIYLRRAGGPVAAPKDPRVILRTP